MRGTITPSSVVPVIPHIHQRILDAVTGDPDALDMGMWHTCDTTHCRAGWVTHLAGEAGAALEAYHGMPLAAQLIYRASPIRVSPPRFFESAAVALADIRRCADEEAALGS